eukprot:CAMPEP_0184868858 /NCGR_PEP_ID=MMETSP0580-20130426/31971_1 /TAXON_ID=1118495 /ORGANISM="Dactyliosolen fragilissimus" /LENGTH=101 /DNA_ID=CAMNT_0027370005 /DNA_START=26 /DNA_END=328 /DNA_ORIENTATION=-
MTFNTNHHHNSQQQSTLANVQKIQLVLIGPNIPEVAVKRGPIDLLSPTSSKNDNTLISQSPLKSCTVTCQQCLYHDHITTQPHLAIAFNAGIWGYDEWKAT